MTLDKIKEFFSSDQTFDDNESILKYQTIALLIISFSFGLGVLSFSYIRLNEGNYIVGVSQIVFGFFLLHGFFRLKHDKYYYQFYSIGFMLLFFIYSGIIFFYVPQNHLNILWVASAPILIYFFLNRAGGTIMFVFVSLFIIYLILSGYNYNPAEFTTLIAAFLITTFVMYTYEKVKDSERSRLVLNAKLLQSEVDVKTKDLKILNEKLESKFNDEFEKRVAQEQMLLRQYRMASLGEMIDSIAHQWRQPLMNINAILMNIDRESEIQKHSPKYLESKIDEISNLTSHMSQTIDDFRFLFKEDKEKKTFRAQSLIDDVLLIMRSELGNIKIDLNCNKQIEIFGFRSEIMQTIIIILSNAKNALKASTVESKLICIDIHSNSHHIQIDIEDNAGGIDEAIINKIFNPYYTTQEKNGGSGLGLYIAKIIVEHNMQGEITASNSTKGAKFRISIPAKTSNNN